MENFPDESFITSWSCPTTDVSRFDTTQLSLSGPTAVNIMNIGNSLPHTMFYYCAPAAGLEVPMYIPDISSSPPTSCTESTASSINSTYTAHSSSRISRNDSVRIQGENLISSKAQRRREQNRRSQRSFRERQAKYIKHLEHQLQIMNKHEHLQRNFVKLQYEDPELDGSLVNSGMNGGSPWIEESVFVE